MQQFFAGQQALAHAAAHSPDYRNSLPPCEQRTDGTRNDHNQDRVPDADDAPQVKQDCQFNQGDQGKEKYQSDKHLRSATLLYHENPRLNKVCHIQRRGGHLLRAPTTAATHPQSGRTNIPASCSSLVKGLLMVDSIDYSCPL